MKPFTSVIDDKLCAMLFVALVILTIGLNLDVDRGADIERGGDAATTLPPPTATGIASADPVTRRFDLWQAYRLISSRFA